MMKMMKTQRKGERGNALFLILIAVALFAALSYAVTQSGRGSGGVDRETALIAAAQITQYPASLRTTVTRMVITGTDVTDLDFTNTTGQDDEVFDQAGGGASIQAPPANIGEPGVDWVFLDALHATDGWYVLDVGSNATTSGREVLVTLGGDPSISEAICTQINRGLDLPATPAVEATAVDTGTPLNGAGAADNAGTFTSASTQEGSGQPFACVENGTGSNDFIYYHALAEQ